ncbi:ABC transporter substrate-binding protein [Hypericibacter sp.]|uniref:ABC transporter substrate-binding protein n=1 Tax=Hypericibacter sp. TaxID=2705401 RepID=UPI003D6D982D
MKRVWPGIGAGLLLAAGMIGNGAAPAAAATHKIVMMVTWIGCEDVCKGVQDYIAENKIDAEVVVRNAAGDKTRFAGFVQEARAMKADVVVTWGTNATLSIVGTLADQGNKAFLDDIPVVFTVVADPVGAKITESYDKTGRPNLTGTRNRVPETVNIKSIRRYQPDFQHLGMLFDPSAPNSVNKVEEVKALTGDLDFTLDALPLDLDASGAPMVESIAPKMEILKRAGVEWVYLGSSPFLEKNQDAFTGAAVDDEIAVLSPYEHLVTESQALMSVAARDYDVGNLAGQQVASVLNGSKPGDLPVLAIDQFAYLVNMKVAKKLNLYPPVEFLQFVVKVE